MLDQAATVVISTTTILGVLAILAVALRLYCRKLQKLSFGGDDYCMIIALILSTGISIISDYTAATTGVGDPAYTPSLDAVIFAMKANYAAENAQIATMGFVKVSLLLFYRRIFVTRPFLRSNNILIGLVTCFTLAVLLTIIFSKWPVYDQWNPEVPYNINVSAILIAYVSGNALFDLLTLCLPLAALRSLQMDVHRKLLLTTLFTLGSACIFASLFRLYYAVKYVRVPEKPTSFFQVPFIYNDLWAIIEPPVFIMAGCFLTFGPLYQSRAKSKRYFQSLWSRLSRPLAKLSARSFTQTNSISSGGNHVWKILQEREKGKNATNRAQWELSNVKSSEESEPPVFHSLANMV